MQVFAATDLETKADCVVKRPHPSLISRNIHDDVERRMSLQASLRTTDVGKADLPKLMAVTEPDRFKWYFGDDLGFAYSAYVERRATGVPLVGSVRDQVRGHPVGLPFNLFALHPSTKHLERKIKDPSLTVLSVIERCFESGFLAGDLGPRNLFYSPCTGQATVIDLGSLRMPRPEGPRSPSLDLNDILLEFFQFYTSPDNLPTSADGFSQVREQRYSGPLKRMAMAMIETHSTAGLTTQREAAESILHRIAHRTYQSVGDFRSDFGAYLSEASARQREPSTDKAWTCALKGLFQPYWTKYLFEADLELGHYC